MNAVNPKSNLKYPNLLDSWSTILGMGFLLLGIAGVMFMLGYSRGQTVKLTNGLAILSSLTIGSVIIGILFANIASGRYISQVYHVSWWRQALRSRRTNFNQSIGVFSPTSLEVCARRIGLNPKLVIVILYALLPFDVLSLIVGFITR